MFKCISLSTFGNDTRQPSEEIDEGNAYINIVVQFYLPISGHYAPVFI